MSETLSSQIKRRTRVVGLFPNESSLLRIVTGVIIEISERWEISKVHLQPETKKQPNLPRFSSRPDFNQENLQKKIARSKIATIEMPSQTPNS